MRNPDKSKKEGMVNVANRERLPLQVIPLDVTDDKSVKEAVDKIATVFYNSKTQNYKKV
jgi:hypothetical protein